MKRLLPIILIIISGIFLKPQAVLANIPGAATGTKKKKKKKKKKTKL